MGDLPLGWGNWDAPPPTPTAPAHRSKPPSPEVVAAEVHRYWADAHTTHKWEWHPRCPHCHAEGIGKRLIGNGR